MTDGKEISVWFLSGWYPTRVHTTRGNFVEKHAEAASRFCKVAVLHVCTDPTLQQKKEITYSEDKGFPVLIIYLRAGGKIPLWSAMMRYFRFRSAYNEGSRLLLKKSSAPDLIHSNILFPVTFYTRMLARRFNIPYLITEHWTGYLDADPVNPSKSNLCLSKKFARKAAALLPVTDALGAAMQSRGLKGNYITVNNVVDTSLFKQRTTVRSARTYRLLHISTLHPQQKNFEGLLRSLALVKQQRTDFVMDVISDGDFEQYRETIDQLGLSEHLIFHGKLQTAQIAEITAQCDLLVLFSRYENFPCVIPEALSSGIPVLSTRVGGIHEHLTADLGTLAESEDETSFANKLSEMLDHLDQYNPATLHAYAEAHFSYEAVGKKLYAIYQQTISK